MKTLDKIKNNAYKYNLKIEYINNDTLKVYSEKYAFDSWLIKEGKYDLEILHLNKAFGNKKCTYHTQARVKKHNWLWTLQRIQSHNKFVGNHNKKRIYGNLVDIVLNRNKQEGLKNAN